MLQRSGADYKIKLPVTVTPVAAVSRLEHALSKFEAERYRYRHRLADARRCLASYQPRSGAGLASTAELDLKLQQLAEIEKDLAATGELEEAIDRAAA